jgi:hypothetical protein
MSVVNKCSGASGVIMLASPGPRDAQRVLSKRTIMMGERIVSSSERLTHTAHILEVVGESYRVRQRLREAQ